MARRGHGEGCISARDDGRWMARITLEGGKRKTFYGKTRAEVKDKLIAALKDQQDGLLVDTPRQTFGQFLTRWLEDSVKPSVRPTTYVSYSAQVRLHIMPELGGLALAKVTPQRLQSFYAKKLEQGLSARTVQYLHRTLHRALGQALKWRLVPRNPCDAVDSPKVKRHEIRPFSREEAGRFLEAVKGHRLEALFTVAVACGLRQGEILGLGWDDVDLDRGTLHVRRALQCNRIDGKREFLEPKSAKGRRTVTLPKTVVNALHAHRARQLEERLLAGSRWQECGLVFASTVGTPLDARNVVRQFKELLQGASLPDMRFHDLRHSCATILLAQNVHPRIVMEVLGHSQIGLTLDTYSHILPSMQQEAAALMDAVLTGQK